MKVSMFRVRSLFVAGVGVLPLAVFSQLGYAGLVASVLPVSRSVEVGNTATVFATIINTGSIAATDCGISLARPLDADFGFQPTDPATNALIGQPDTPVDIPANQHQSFIVSVTPTASIAPTDVPLRFDCSNTDPAPSIPGVNMLQFSASNQPIPDVVALAATLGNDGIVHLDGNIGAFAVAAVNLGAGDGISAIADTGNTELPLNITLCETIPATGECIAPPST